jgi:hypothetical protein
MAPAILKRRTLRSAVWATDIQLFGYVTDVRKARASIAIQAQLEDAIGIELSGAAPYDPVRCFNKSHYFSLETPYASIDRWTATWVLIEISVTIFRHNCDALVSQRFEGIRSGYSGTMTGLEVSA